MKKRKWVEKRFKPEDEFVVYRYHLNNDINAFIELRENLIRAKLTTDEVFESICKRQVELGICSNTLPKYIDIIVTSFNCSGIDVALVQGFHTNRIGYTLSFEKHQVQKNNIPKSDFKMNREELLTKYITENLENGIRMQEETSYRFDIYGMESISKAFILNHGLVDVNKLDEEEYDEFLSEVSHLISLKDFWKSDITCFFDKKYLDKCSTIPDENVSFVEVVSRGEFAYFNAEDEAGITVLNPNHHFKIAYKNNRITRTEPINIYETSSQAISRIWCEPDFPIVSKVLEGGKVVINFSDKKRYSNRKL